jgi:phosphoglycerol transferase MdoB-like AlkP superfamily enzyme
MKAMQYYDHCLQQFFNASKNETWFSNTTFIFCSDHWMFPQGKQGTYNPVFSYHIPVIIFDPAEPKKKIINRLASQFDVHATFLSVAGYPDTIISYGNDLQDSSITGNYIYSKQGNAIYQVMDSNYVLGFNTVNNKVEYLFDYKRDKELNINLAPDKNAAIILNTLLTRVKAFLQKTTLLYNNNPVK